MASAPAAMQVSPGGLLDPAEAPLGLGPGVDSVGLLGVAFDALGAMNEWAGMKNTIETLGQLRRAQEEIVQRWMDLKPGEVLEGSVYKVMGPGEFVWEIGWTANSGGVIGANIRQKFFRIPMDQQNFDVIQRVKNIGASGSASPKAGGR